MQIKDYVQHCTVCQATDKPAKSSPAPLQPVEFPLHPWTKLGIDIVGPFEQAPAKERFFITVVDYHSKWPEVAAVSSVTTGSVINFLKSIFSRERLPQEFTSDNGPQFTSREFSQFLETNGIKHTKSALYHPQANGQVEIFNRVLKSTIQLALVQQRSIYTQSLSILVYIEAHSMLPREKPQLFSYMVAIIVHVYTFKEGIPMSLQYHRLRFDRGYQIGFRAIRKK